MKLEKLQKWYDLLCEIRDKLGVVGAWPFVGDKITDLQIDILKTSNYQIDIDNYQIKEEYIERRIRTDSK